MKFKNFIAETPLNEMAYKLETAISKLTNVHKRMGYKFYIEDGVIKHKEDNRGDIQTNNISDAEDHIEDFVKSFKNNKLINKLFNITYVRDQSKDYNYESQSEEYTIYNWIVSFTPKNPESVIGNDDVDLSSKLATLDIQVLSAIKDSLKQPKKLSNIIDNILRNK